MSKEETKNIDISDDSKEAEKLRYIEELIDEKMSDFLCKIFHTNDSEELANRIKTYAEILVLGLKEDWFWTKIIPPEEWPTEKQLESIHFNAYTWDWNPLTFKEKKEE